MTTSEMETTDQELTTTEVEMTTTEMETTDQELTATDAQSTTTATAMTDQEVNTGEVAHLIGHAAVTNKCGDVYPADQDTIACTAWPSCRRGRNLGVCLFSFAVAVMCRGDPF